MSDTEKRIKKSIVPTSANAKLGIDGYCSFGKKRSHDLGLHRFKRYCQTLLNEVSLPNHIDLVNGALYGTGN